MQQDKTPFPDIFWPSVQICIVTTLVVKYTASALYIRHISSCKKSVRFSSINIWNKLSSNVKQIKTD